MPHIVVLLLFYCCATTYDAGPALKQHRFNDSSVLGVEYLHYYTNDICSTNSTLMSKAYHVCDVGLASTQQIQAIETILVYCWPKVPDDGPLY